MSTTVENQRCPREGSLMPREIVAWLRGLRLPRSVRNPKRDFSNGFLVAMICSRYWSALSMHTYEDNLSVSNKQRNWEQLRKQFAAQDCPLSDRMIEGMIECRNGYADSFLRQLYTQLTGRALVEAAPLPTGKTVQVPEYVPPMAPQPRQRSKSNYTKSNTDGVAAQKPRESASVEMRVRELPAYVSPNTSTSLQRLENRDDTSATLAHTQSMRAVGSEDALGVHGDARPPVAFEISLHHATTGQTVVRKETPGAKPSASRDFSAPPPFSATIDRHTTLADFMERLVRAETAGLAWPSEPPAAADSREPAMPATSRFLRAEPSLERSAPRRVWGALLAAAADAAECARRGGGSVAPVAALLLRPPGAPDKDKEKGKNKDKGKDKGKGEGAAGSSRSGSFCEPAARPAVPQRLAFLAALLAAIADADPLLAAPAFVNDVLPHAVGAMRQLDHTNVAGYAGLFCAALPAEKRLAAQLLPDLLAATHDAVTLPETAEARRSFYLLLRTILTRLARRVWRGFSSANQTKRHLYVSSPQMLTATTTSGSLSSVDVMESNDGESLSRVIASVGSYHTIAALSHDSAAVRLAGTSLAEGLAASGAPPTFLFGPVLTLLLRAGHAAEHTHTVHHCLRAAWLCMALRRYALSPEDSNYAAAAPRLADLLRDMCRILCAPGLWRTRTFIAQQLALSLHNMIGPCFNVEEAAIVVIQTLDAVPFEDIAIFMGSANNNSHVSRHSGALVSCALLGQLCVDGAMRDCHPLLLSEAVLAVFPPNKEDSKEEDTKATKPRKLSQSKLMHRAATAMLREGSIPEEVSKRIVWLHRIFVGCRDAGEAIPEIFSAVAEGSAAQRWRQVMQAMYLDLSTVFSAAEILFAQKHNIAEDVARTIGQMAGMAQELVLRWWDEVHRAPPALGSRGSLVVSATSPDKKRRNSVELQTHVAKAMQWYQETFREESQGDVNPERKSTGKNTNDSHTSAGGK